MNPRYTIVHAMTQEQAQAAQLVAPRAERF